MKKIISILIVLSIVLTLFTACSNPLEMITGNTNVKYKVVDDHAEVVELPNVTGLTEIVIDDEYKDVPVTVIKDFAGCNLEFIEKISIGKNVEEIGPWSFTNNKALKEFDVSSDNEHYCSIDGVLYTKDVKTILSFPAANSKKYEIPDSVETIRAHAFYKCDKIEEIELPENLKAIEEKAFFRCSSLKDVELLEGIEVIGKDAFGYCSGIESIEIPSSIKEIKEYAFYNCTALLEVKINAKEADIKLGKEWQPTNNGLKIDELKISFE